MVWRWRYYGALLPNSLLAKAGFFETLQSQPQIFLLLSISYLLNWALKWGLLWWLPLAWTARREPLAYPLFITLSYTLLVAAVGGGDWMPLQRLILPALAAWMWIALWGWRKLRARHQKLATLLLLLLIIAQLDLPALMHFPRDTRHLDVWWRETMSELAQVAGDDISPMATTVLGRTGYYFPGPVLDAFGLTDATIAREGKPLLRMGRTDWDYVLAQRPVFILINDPQKSLRAQLAQDKRYFWLPLIPPPDFPILLMVRADHAQQAAENLNVTLRPADDPAMDQWMTAHWRQMQQQALGPLYDSYCQTPTPQCQRLWLLLRP